jgi:predicted metal-binding membrane protein
MRSSGGRDIPAAVPAGIALAWTVLLAAELTRAPMSHDELAGGSLPLPATVGIFGLGWVAMVAAMMLPSSYPMVRAFAATTGDRPGQRDRPGIGDPPGQRGGVPRFPGGRAGGVAGFLGGYVAVWTVFGLALFAADLGLHALIDSSSQPFATHTTLIGNILLIAGAFQLTDRKRRCLDSCRHPAEFLRRHGRVSTPEPAAVGALPGPVATVAAPVVAAEGAAAAAGLRFGGGAAARVGAFRLGRRYGVHCLGSCWALMLVVFALGRPEILWMAAFGAVMLYEKVARQGLVGARLAGAALLVASLVATFA